MPIPNASTPPGAGDTNREALQNLDLDRFQRVLSWRLDRPSLRGVDLRQLDQSIKSQPQIVLDAYLAWLHANHADWDLVNLDDITKVLKSWVRGLLKYGIATRIITAAVGVYFTKAVKPNTDQTEVCKLSIIEESLHGLLDSTQVIPRKSIARNQHPLILSGFFYKGPASGHTGSIVQLERPPEECSEILSHTEQSSQERRAQSSSSQQSHRGKATEETRQATNVRIPEVDAVQTLRSNLIKDVEKAIARRRDELNKALLQATERNSQADVENLRAYIDGAAWLGAQPDDTSCVADRSPLPGRVQQESLLLPSGPDVGSGASTSNMREEREGEARSRSPGANEDVVEGMSSFDLDKFMDELSDYVVSRSYVASTQPQ